MCLPPLILLEQLDGDCRSFDVAGGACVLRGVGDDALVRYVERSAGDPDDRGLEVDVLPLQPTQFFPAHSGEHEHLDHRSVLHILAVEQGEQLSSLFLVDNRGPRRAPRGGERRSDEAIRERATLTAPNERNPRRRISEPTLTRMLRHELPGMIKADLMASIGLIMDRKKRG